MAIDLVPISQQARANGLMWGAKIIGTSTSLAFGSWLLNSYGYSSSILMLAVFVGLIIIVPLCLRERPEEKVLPWTAGTASVETKKIQTANWSTIFKSLFKVFTLRNSFLLAFATFITQGAYSYTDTLLPIFTVNALGWTDQEYSKFFATTSLIGGVGGMLIGGILIDRFGKLRMLNIYFFLAIVFSALVSFLTLYWASKWFISAYMITYKLLYVFVCIGLFATAMQCCWKKVSATQFTLYMTIGNIGRLVGAKLIGPAKSYFSWEITLFLFAGMLTLAWIAIRSIHIDRHVEQIAALENKNQLRAIVA
jgi:PAT family beta-lactamase induction signal transducer AmpG